MHDERVERCFEVLAAGRLQARETIVDGIDSAVEAFLGLLRGQNTGKMVVRLPDSTSP